MDDGEQLDPATIATLRGGRKRPVHVERFERGPDPRQVCPHEHRQQLYSDRDYCQKCGKPVKR